MIINRCSILTLLAVFAVILPSNSQSIDIVDYATLESRWSSNSDTTYVINYWATWCGPCVAELPDFIEANEAYKDGPFKMILVSLDFPNQLERRVAPFVEKNRISPEVVLLDDNANIWINRVNEEWDGNIPVTQFIKGEYYQFHEGQMSHKELLTQIEYIHKL